MKYCAGKGSSSTFMLISGEYDFLCNYMGLYDMVQQMIWNGEKGFSNNTRKQDFIVMNKTVSDNYPANVHLTIYAGRLPL
jgi:carboxypeptidase C (cathepsin A)